MRPFIQICSPQNSMAGALLHRPLLHRTIHELSTKIAVRLPHTNQLALYHINGCFPLTKDPIKEGKATLIGMMVLRPAFTAWDGAWNSFDKVNDWCYGLSGLVH
jgi:hypothetical protein